MLRKILFTLMLLGISTQPSLLISNPEPQDSTHPLSIGGIELNITDFGAIPDGQMDCTEAIQKAIDKASATGGIVRLPAGKLLVSGNLVIKSGVTLTGVYDAPQSINHQNSTIILATAGRDDESAPPLFLLQTGSMARGFVVWYPEQTTDNIRPYPWTFQITGFDTTIENITLINSYNGIVAGPENNVRHRIRSVVGCVLRRGIFIDSTTDIGRIENIQFHCHWWSTPEFGGSWEPVFTFMSENLEGFVFGRTDWEYVTNNFIFPAKIGYRFIQTKEGACNGQFTGNGADATQIAVQVDAIQPMGLLFTGGQFVSFIGDKPTQIVISPTNQGNVRFVNCAFWGPAWQCARIEGNGFVSFSDCYFQLDPGAAPIPGAVEIDRSKNPIIEAHGGRLQVNNCSFSRPNTAVFVGEGVKSAIITGNNGIYERLLEDNSGKAIVRDNERDE